jgi:hypothetical protein
VTVDPSYIGTWQWISRHSVGNWQRHFPYTDGLQAGRPPFDMVMMFKILVRPALNDLSDERIEFFMNDRCIPVPKAVLREAALV